MMSEALREIDITAGIGLISTSTPFSAIPIALFYVFRMRRRDKLAVSLLFIFVNILFGNFNYISFLLIFLAAILLLNWKVEILLLLASFLSFLIPSKFTFQILFMVFGIALLLAFISPAIISMYAKKEVKSKEELRRELYQKLARIK